MAERKSIPYSERKYDKANKIAYDQQYQKDHYDRVTILLPKGMKDTIKGIASKDGKTMSIWISELIDKKLNEK